MKVGVRLNIDVTKIDKSQLYQGEKGTYLNVTAFIDIDSADQYGNNGMITQELSKECRDAGNKGAILGNSKVFWRDGGNGQQQAPQQQTPQYNEPPMDFDDDIPF